MRKVTSIDELLKEAVSLGATDLHVATGSRPRYRLHGELKELDYEVLSTAKTESLVYSHMDTLARATLNATGQYDMSYSLPGGARFRVNIFKQKGDYAGVYRILPSKILNYSSLGLPISVFNLYRKRRGMILIVGPTGSGKTTTLASFLDVINSNLYKHIVTLEDPIEYLHWHNRSIVNQREVGPGLDCDTFANGLRAALREDPDVILIGEMRDLETTEIALMAAETGHLVCSTLHTLGAAETINRIIDMYPEGQYRRVRSQLNAVLEAVVSQQLLPKADGTGYAIAYEIMYRNRKIREMILNDRVDDISDYLASDEARKEGMCDMDSTIVSLYRRGIIEREVAVDYAIDSKLMRTRL